jgi:hypothetical protein
MDDEERAELAEDAFHRFVREKVAPAYEALADVLRDAADLAQDMEQKALIAGYQPPERWVNGDDPETLAMEMVTVAEEERTRGLRKEKV